MEAGCVYIMQLKGFIALVGDEAFCYVIIVLR